MGTSSSGGGSPIGRVDHPHAYGDKQGLKHFDTVADGSSPRVWGQEKSLVRVAVLFGIIPTRMGTRIFLHKISRWASDHPHAYGDKSMTVADIVP